MAGETQETAVMPEMEMQGTDVRQATGLALFPAVLKKSCSPVSNSVRSIRLEYNKWLESRPAIRAERRLLILGAVFTIPKFDPNQQHKLKRIESKGQL